jgi:hypothetical protein
MPSSVISYFFYDRGSQTLHVRFLSGTEYEYKNVPEWVYEEMRKAISKGSFLNKYIKGMYEFSKVR